MLMLTLTGSLPASLGLIINRNINYETFFGLVRVRSAGLWPVDDFEVMAWMIHLLF